MVLVTENMKRLSHISAYRLLIFLIIGLYFNNKYIFLLETLILLVYKSKESIIFIVLILIIFLTNSIKTDYIKYGIVEKKMNNYFVIDKILYKTKIQDDEIEIGDILYTNKYEFLNDETYLKKNIKFSNTDYSKITSLSIRKYIYNLIQNKDDNTRTALNKFIYNITNYDDLTYNLGFGLASYYLIKEINKKNKKVSLITIFVYSLLFYFDIKFYLLIIDFILDKFQIKNKIVFKFCLICLINVNLLKDYSIEIPLFLGLFGHFSDSSNFKIYFMLMQSILFGYINIISSFLYKYYIKIQIILLIFSVMVIFIPSLTNIYSFILNLYSTYNNLDLNIRGSISLITTILYLLIKNALKIKNVYLKIVLILLLIISPINNPFYHVSFIDVGQGDSILIKSELNKSNVLIDTGSTYNYYKLKKYLFSQGIYNIDYLIITHNDSDHNGNLDQIQKDFKIKNIITSPIDIRSKNIHLYSLYTDEYDNDNDNSLVYYTKINDIGILFTGDISKKCERKLINKYPNLDVDVLKISHHGSNTASSEYFISNIIPKIACISTSGQYGHPHKQTLENLEKFLVKIYSTKQEKNIEIYFTKLANILKTDNLSFAIIK